MSARTLRRGTIAASRVTASIPITATLLTSGEALSNAPVTASVSPAANRLLLLAVHFKTDQSFTPGVVTVTGNGLTWVSVNSIVTDSLGATRGRLRLFRAMGAAPTSGPISMSEASGFNLRFAWVLVELANVDTSGTNGSGAIVQTWGIAGTNNTPSATLQSAFGSPANATFGACGHSSSSAQFTAGSGFTKIAESGTNAAPIASWCAVEFRPDNDTTVDGTLTDGSAGWGIIPVEIKAAA